MMEVRRTEYGLFDVLPKFEGASIIGDSLGTYASVHKTADAIEVHIKLAGDMSRDAFVLDRTEALIRELQS